MTTWTQFESRVDWITATAKIGPAGEELLRYGGELLNYERERGNPNYPKAIQGYTGTQGTHVYLGWRLDGAMLRCGGELARDSWRDLVKLATNITRVDLAITIRSDPPYASLACDCWQNQPAAALGRGVQGDCELRQTRRHGQALLCNSRSSDRYGRIYDKHAENPEEYEPGDWRCEVEYKGEPARAVAEYLLARSNDEQEIAAIVLARYQRWGVNLPVEAPRSGFVDRAVRSLTTDETRLRWLSNTISITIDRLKGRYTGDELRRAVRLEVERATTERQAWPDYTNDDEPGSVTRKRCELVQWAYEVGNDRDRT